MDSMALLSTFNRYYNLGAAEPKSTLANIYPQKKTKNPYIDFVLSCSRGVATSYHCIASVQRQKEKNTHKKRGLRESPQYKHTKAQNHACTPAATRTQDLPLRRRLLYPIELLEQKGFLKAVYLNKICFNLRIKAVIPSYRRFSSITTRMTAPAIPADATHNFNNSLMISISFIHDAVVIH